MTLTTIQPPTSYLPPITKIATCSTTQLSEFILYLHLLYRPRVRGSRRRRQDNSPQRGGDDDGEGLVCSDAFERAYAIRWLTALIAQLEACLSTIDDADILIQRAASLLATCAGVAAAGKLQRRFSFESTLVGRFHVDLIDIPLDNHDYGSVGAQTWGGACVLAEMIAERPDRFGLRRKCPSELANGLPPLRILELGAGTGLVGLTVAKLLHALPLTLRSRASIVLTDVYPAVLDNLQSNIQINFSADPDETDYAILVDSYSLDWSSFSTTKTIPDILSTPFDIILGADIVYEGQHAVWIRDCLKSLLSYPHDSNKDPTFHLVVPLRPTHTFESSTIEDVFGPSGHVLDGSQRELTILSKESIICEAYRDRSIERSRMDDDVEYVYYRIGWSQ